MAEVFIQPQLAFCMKGRHLRTGAGATGRAIDGAGPGCRTGPVEFAVKPSPHFSCGHPHESSPRRARQSTRRKNRVAPDEPPAVAPRAALIISLIRTMSRPSFGISRNPKSGCLRDDIKHAAIRDIDGHCTHMGHFNAGIQIGRKRGHILKSNPLHFAVGTSARTRINPAGTSRVNSVTGSRIGSIPVSSRTVVTQLCWCPTCRDTPPAP